MAEYSIRCANFDGEKICEEYKLHYHYDVEEFGVVYTESGNIAYHDKKSLVVIPHAVFERMIEDYKKFKEENQ